MAPADALAQPSHLSPQAVVHYRRLFGDLRNEWVKRASRGVWSDAESREWSQLSEGHRMALMLLGGIDGDLVALSRRAWRELPEPERQEIKAQARFAREAFRELFAMTARY